MTKSRIFTLIVISTTICCNIYQGCSQRVLLEIGPRDITRTVGETNVYIPCPFIGHLSPMWVINGILYEAFNLPENMFSVSFGLLIPYVESNLDGTTFQCYSIVPSDSDMVYKKSTVGILTVKEAPPELQGLLKPSDYVLIDITTSLNLDHQRTIFESEFKTLSWINVPECGRYEIISSKCAGTQVRIWDQNIIQATTLSVPSIYLVDSDNRSLFFNLTAINENSGALCETFQPYIVIEQTDITEALPVSFGGFCVDLTSTIGPIVVFPSKSHGRDCPCSIFFAEPDQSVYTLKPCSCAQDTIFEYSFLVNVTQLEFQLIYHACFLNLTSEMNSTIIHFYELYRACYDEQGSARVKPYRQYFKSLKINIVLPDPPDITVNSKSGYINFSSPFTDRISVDFYQVIIMDITGNEVINSSTYDSDSSSVGDLFQSTTCSPYQVTVKAHNSYGSTERNNTVNGDRQGDECHCIIQNVHADVVNLLPGGESGITMVVNCSQTYVSDVELNITIQQMGNTINSSLVACHNSSYITIESLKCNNEYDFLIFWSPASAGGDLSQCQISINRSQILHCSEMNSSSSFKLLIIISSVSFVTIMVLILIILCLICFIFLRRRKESVRIQY